MMSEEEIKIIKSIIYNDQGKKMSYVDVNYAEGENFINAVDKLLVEYKQQQKEIEKLKEPKYLYNANTGEITQLENSNYISKDKIRKFIKEELPDDEIMETCQTYDINGVLIREALEELLEE